MNTYLKKSLSLTKIYGLQINVNRESCFPEKSLQICPRKILIGNIVSILLIYLKRYPLNCIDLFTGDKHILVILFNHFLKHKFEFFWIID